MKKLVWVLFGGLCIVFSLHPIKYLVADEPILLLTSKSVELLSSTLYNATFYLHIIFGGISLLVGWVQFIKWLRVKHSKIHRLIGKIYIASVLISGIPGLYIAIHASGGLSPKLGFGLGAILWVIFTYGGYQAIRQGNVKLHKQLLMYSYAGTFGAVTLRLWLPLLMWIFGEFVLAYQVVAWLSWLPNIVIVYLIIRWEQNRSAISSFPSLDLS